MVSVTEGKAHSQTNIEWILIRIYFTQNLKKALKCANKLFFRVVFMISMYSLSTNQILILI